MGRADLIRKQHLSEVQRMLKSAGASLPNTNDKAIWQTLNLLIGATQEIASYLEGDHAAGDY